MSRGFLVALIVAGLGLVVPAPALGFEALEEYGAGELSGPRGVAVDPGNGSLYVADAGNDRIAVFDAAGDFSRAIGPETLAAPRDVALDPDNDELYVADTGNERVAVFSLEGDFLREIGPLEEPLGLDFDLAGEGLAYVAEAAAQRVGVYTPNGELDRFVGSAGEASGQLSEPVDVTLVPTGRLAVADAANHRIDFFFESGQFILAAGRNVNAGIVGDPDVCTLECQAGEPDGAEGDVGTPSSVAADSGGDVYVADEQWQRAVRLESDGEFASSFGDGELDLPSGIASACLGSVFVSQRGPASRVVRYGEPGALPPPCVQLPESLPPPLVAPPPPPKVVSRFGIRRVVRNRRKGIAFAIVKVHSPGRLILRGRGIRRAVRGTQRAPRLLRLPIRPKVRLRRYLRRKGRAKIRFKVTFRPYGGTPFTRERQLTLRKRR